MDGGPARGISRENRISLPFRAGMLPRSISKRLRTSGDRSTDVNGPRGPFFALCSKPAFDNRAEAGGTRRPVTSGALHEAGEITGSGFSCGDCAVQPVDLGGLCAIRHIRLGFWE